MTPLALYLGALAFGGLFIGASVLGGHDGHGGADGHGGGHDGHGEGEGGHGGDHHDGHDSSGDGHHGPATALLPLLSLRFWTFSLAFFGLTGAVLTAMGALSVALVPVVAGGAGVGAGYVASRLLGALAGKPVGLLTAAGPHLGREGILLLPVTPDQRGKVRVTVGGSSTDLVAATESGEPLPAGSTVLIIAMRGTVALVERSPAASLAAAGNDSDPDPDKENR